MKKIFKNSLFTFILGGILFSGVTYAATVLANSISYDNTNSGLSANNVQGAIDELYNKANTSYDEYSGTTTYTPSTSTQTISTNNKLMKSDITINPIPSSYKNLSSNTTVNANNLANGVTAYNNNGQLITGTLNYNCVEKNYVLTQSNLSNMLFDFVPSRLFLYFEGFNYPMGFYNGTVVTQYETNNDSTYGYSNFPISDVFTFTNNKTYFDTTKSWWSVYYNTNIHMMACK